MSKKLLLSLILALASLIASPYPGAQTVSDGGVQPIASRDKFAESAFQRDAPVPAWVDRIASLPSSRPNAPATPIVARLNDVYFYVDEKPSITIHKALQVNEASVLAQIGQSEITFQPDYQRVQLHVLRIHRGDQVMDKMRDADIRFLRREPELDNGIYGGAVTAAIVVNDVRVGDTLEIAYTTTGSNPVFGNRFFDAAGWDYPYPTLKRRVTLNAPEGRRIQYRVIGNDLRNPPQAAESRANGRRIVRFEANDLTPVDYENYTPRDYQTARWLQFSEFASWKEVSQWADKLFAVKTDAAALLSAAGIERGQANLPDKVSKALQFVQNNIRYLSVSLGENSHRPYPPDQVLARRYGDCKDKSLLLVTLLRQLNVEASPVLVPTTTRKGIDQMLPSPQMFDHAIVRAVVQGKVYYLDPTRLGQAGKLDRMGQVHAYTQVLVVAPDTDKLAEIAPPANEELITGTRFERVAVTRMNEPATMSVQLLYTGTDAEAARAGLSKVTPAQLRKFYEGNIGKRHPAAVMLGDPKITDDRDDNRMTIDLQFRIPDFIQPAQANWMLHYQPSNLRGLFFVPDNANRTTPLSLPAFPSINRYVLEVTLPEEYDARYTPSQRSVQSPSFSLSQELSFTGRQLKAVLELRMLADRVAARDTSQFLTDINKASEMLQGTLTIRQTDLKSARVAKPQLGFKQALAERLENIVKSAGQVVADARLMGRDASAALCERARAEAYLGRNPEAVADVQNATAQQSGAPEMVRCRAEVELATGDFKAGEQSFSRAIAMGQKDSNVYLQRGIAGFYQGRLDVAAGDFLKAGDAAQNPAEKIRARIWHTLALRRAGKKIDNELLVADADAWPGAGLAVLTGRQTPEAMFRTAQNQSGDAGEIALAEAYFYAGQYFLLSGDKLKARLYFQHALDKGVLYAPFHLAARQEIAVLK
ncbi:lipoprotein NlpI, contains TPR repeats [Herbaspirillum sp. CF444]|uniref:DUF3857 domain-containing protein n=1 Tax=Herbaspirillum sp. CF444 TaxID=1144319 RepID=UPI0002723993|nr:DUF3857 domain-containing protein [Herbaspirillum sp. CF444]EJL94428.1 lipoprotein NlpI, contains TPR repeats [Herbaspirillum sp. CF444]